MADNTLSLRTVTSPENGLANNYEALADLFTDNRISPQALAALYDCLAHNRTLLEVKQNGLYIYQTHIPNSPPEQGLFQVDYLPLPVALNPETAIRRLDSKYKTAIAWLQFNQDGKKLWEAACSINEGQAQAHAVHPSLKQARARAIMAAHCQLEAINHRNQGDQ